MQWETIIAAGIAAVVGIVGIFGTIWGVRHQTQSALQAEARQRRFQISAGLLGIAYQVGAAASARWLFDKSGFPNYRENFDNAPWLSDAGLVDRAYEYLALCKMDGDEKLTSSAQKLARSIESAYTLAALGKPTNGSELLLATRAFERAAAPKGAKEHL